MSPIHLRNVPPPEETFDHVSLISFIASYLKPERYLELGVRCGKTFKSVAKYAKEAIAVDIAPCAFDMPNNGSYHHTTTDSYFENLNGDVKFDMIFIDGDHSHEQSLQDFLNASLRIIDDGFIIMHDTYPFDKVLHAPHYCNDCYKTALYVKQNYSHSFEVLTLPFNPGVTLIKKMPQNKQLIYQQ